MFSIIIDGMSFFFIVHSDSNFYVFDAIDIKNRFYFSFYASVFFKGDPMHKTSCRQIADCCFRIAVFDH